MIKRSPRSTVTIFLLPLRGRPTPGLLQAIEESIDSNYDSVLNVDMFQ